MYYLTLTLFSLFYQFSAPHPLNDTSGDEKKTFHFSNSTDNVWILCDTNEIINLTGFLFPSLSWLSLNLVLHNIFSVLCCIRILPPIIIKWNCFWIFLFVLSLNVLTPPVDWMRVLFCAIQNFSFLCDSWAISFLLLLADDDDGCLFSLNHTQTLDIPATLRFSRSHHPSVDKVYLMKVLVLFPLFEWNNIGCCRVVMIMVTSLTRWNVFLFERERITNGKTF